MAKLIQFYVPDSFRARTIADPTEPRGILIEFHPRSADTQDGNGTERLWERFLQGVRPAVVDLPGR